MRAITLNEKFILEISNIKAPELFLGVARILKVQLINDQNVRDFADIYEDVLNAFEAAPRKRKRELLKILHDANNAPEAMVNGNRTKNSKETESN